MIDLHPMNDVGGSNGSESFSHQTTSINYSILFNDQQQINAADSLSLTLPMSSFENVESQELGQIHEQEISSELPSVIQDGRTEFGFNSSISSLNDGQSEIRNFNMISRPNHNTPAQPRRKPGRPKKSEPIRAKGRSIINARRQLHNDSAMRSRAKFNTLLNQLWDEVPESQRILVLGGNSSKYLSRADKVEAVVSYIRLMRGDLKLSDRRLDPIFM
jgi:hypothetical protein